MASEKDIEFTVDQYDRLTDYEIKISDIFYNYQKG